MRIPTHRIVSSSVVHCDRCLGAIECGPCVIVEKGLVAASYMDGTAIAKTREAALMELHVACAQDMGLKV